MHAYIEVPLKTIVLPALGAIALMFLAGCAEDTTTPVSTTTTTTEETTSSAMPTPQTPPQTTTTESTETHTVAPAQ